MVRILFVSICGLLLLTSHASAQKEKAQDRNFNNYVEGALVVYSQFKTPSKQESETFYNFLKSKWVYTSCTDDCSEMGKKDANKYVEIKNIQIKK